MQPRDLIALALSAVAAHRLRSLLSALGVAIGISAVVLLTGIGEGSRRYVLAQFTQFGTHVLAINPGKSETVGIPGVLGGTTHKLTLDDAIALLRLEVVTQVVPLAAGTARVEAGERGRSVYCYGVTPSIPEVWRMRVRQGSLWPAGDPRRGAPVAVLGPTLKRELFRDQPALGRFVRIAGRRFRVVGVMESKGRMLGFDIDDAAYIPVATAMALFNLDELNEIDCLFRPTADPRRVKEGVGALLSRRHGGHEDFTITTQTAMLDVLGNVMGVVTVAVAGIGAISLLVGAIGILTMMWIAVGERTGEIGLARALGATRREVELLFLAEAAAIAGGGGVIGLTAAAATGTLLRHLVPGLPFHLAPAVAAAAFGVATATGLAAGVLPARRAARLDPVEALRGE